MIRNGLSDSSLDDTLGRVTDSMVLRMSGPEDWTVKIGLRRRLGENLSRAEAGVRSPQAGVAHQPPSLAKSKIVIHITRLPNYMKTKYLSLDRLFLKVRADYILIFKLRQINSPLSTT